MNEIKAGLPAESEEIRTPFANTLLGLADTKRILGIRYSDWLLGAPSIEGGIATSSMAQDEWGHARLLYAALKDLGHDPVALEHERPAERYGSWDALDGELTDWAHLIAAVVVVDGALSAALESVMEGRYGPLEGRIGKMLGEEEFHAALGEAWFRRLAAAEGEGRERLRSGVEEVLPSSVLCMAPGDDAHDALSDRGLLLPASSLRARLEDRIGPLLQLVDVPFPGDVRPDADWDPVRRRGPGHPSEEAVERARGDRNRALFVE
jgi:ring-1,2-phenylacetyl-CoA epoxidase subunit PaaC